MALLAVTNCFALNLTAEQRLRADRLISVFENSSLDFAYDYVENIHDGRGYTAGRIGFCTGTGDLYLVVKTYAKKQPKNPLVPFLPRLKELAETASDSTQGLKGFPAAWRAAATDPIFRDLQDQAADQMYFKPVLKHTERFGLKFPLSIAALYEANIQHGDGSDPDSLSSMMQEASMLTLDPAHGGREEVWLKEFLKTRERHLLNAADPATRDEWRDSVGRAHVMEKIFREQNFDFHGPLNVNPYGTKFVIP